MMIAWLDSIKDGITMQLEEAPEDPGIPQAWVLTINALIGSALLSRNDLSCGKM